MRKLTQREKSVINKLHKIDDLWPKTLELFGNSGTLLVIDLETHEVLDDGIFIYCDGGDATISYDYDDDQEEHEFINR